MAGPDAPAAVQRARDLAADGVAASPDLFGELVRDPAEADRITAGYLDLAGELTSLPGHTWLAADLSHLALDTDPAGCADRLAAIAGALPEGRRLQVGAEDHGPGELPPHPVRPGTDGRPGVLAGLVARGVPARVYVPFGADWFRYWMRRVAESRGA